MATVASDGVALQPWYPSAPRLGMVFLIHRKLLTHLFLFFVFVCFSFACFVLLSICPHKEMKSIAALKVNKLEKQIFVVRGTQMAWASQGVLHWHSDSPSDQHLYRSLKGGRCSGRPLAVSLVE